MITRRTIATTGIAVSIFVAGCADSTELPGPDPTALLAADIAAGRGIYDNNGCANCHGSDGSGRGPNAAYMNPPPRDYRDPGAYKAGIGVDAVAVSIASGFSEDGAAMPAFSHLTPEQLQQLASFVVSLQRPESERVDVEDAWVAETPPGATVTAGYMTLVTDPEEPDALIQVEAKGARARVHATREEGGSTAMEPVERLEPDAEGRLQLAPGGFHLMLNGLKGPLVAGDVVEMTLYFESNTARRLSVPVRPRGAED